MVPEFSSYGITTVQECKFNDMVQYVLAAPELTEVERAEFQKDLLENDSCVFHMTLGRHLRNKFALWSYTHIPEVDESGTDVSKNHPDAISGSVIDHAKAILKHQLEEAANADVKSE